MEHRESKLMKGRFAFTALVNLTLLYAKEGGAAAHKSPQSRIITLIL